MVGETLDRWAASISPENARTIAVFSLAAYLILNVVVFFMTDHLSDAPVIVFLILPILLTIFIISISKYWIDRSPPEDQGKSIFTLIGIFGIYWLFFIFVLSSEPSASFGEGLTEKAYDWLIFTFLSSTLPMLFGVTYVFAKAMEVDTPGRKMFKDMARAIAGEKIPSDREIRMMRFSGTVIIILSLILTFLLWADIFTSILENTAAYPQKWYIAHWLSIVVFGIGVRFFSFIDPQDFKKIWLMILIFFVITGISFLIWLGYMPANVMSIPLSVVDIGFKSVFFILLVKME